MGKDADILQDAGFKTFKRTGDIYTLFYEKGIDILIHEAIAEKAVKRLVIGTIAVIATTVVLKTLSQIAINALTPVED